MIGAKRDGVVSWLLRSRQVVAWRQRKQRAFAIGMARLTLRHAVGFRNARAIVMACHAGCDEGRRQCRRGKRGEVTGGALNSGASAIALM